ncbi:MAG TPA: Ku protein [Burkholderiales bacterium]|nr:Ku protein [Burkholderiales bacterium]
MPRALWKGAISFGLVHVPVSLHSAEKRNSLDFTLLDRRDFAPVGYKRVNKQTGEEVTWDQIVKGYEYEDGNYVALSDEDFRQANVEATQTVDILAFVDAEDIEPMYFDTPYYLSPTKRGEKGYALLRETLKRSKKAAVATVVIRTRQHIATMLPVGPMLVLNTLRYAKDIKGIDEFELPEEARASAKEVDMALKLVKEMSEKWKPAKYHDSYREDILARIEKKVKAGETHEVAEPGAEEEAPQRKGAEVIDLMALLKRSVAGEGAHKGSARGSARENGNGNGKAHRKTARRARGHHAGSSHERRKRA